MKIFRYYYRFYTKDEIIERIENQGRSIGRYFILKISDNDYEQELVDKGVKHFAYIKFFSDGKDYYGIVAGKSGSRIVNQSGTDISFSIKTTDGPSRRFLEQKKYKWVESEVLVCEGLSPNDPKDAFEVERDLKEMFNLNGS